jgi:two-component system phosphate regulon sensor histidine kinase PhoR
VSSWRPALPYIVLLPLIVAAAGVVSYYTWETASRYEELGESSIAHATLLLVEEKVDRIEQNIISQDNAVFHLLDVSDPESLRNRWLPLASRISPSIRAMMLLTSDLEIVDYAARTGPGEERAFLRTFRKYIAPELQVADLDVNQLRHLHIEHSGTSYLFSYQTFAQDGHIYIAVAHHDVGYIVREEFPRLFANEDARAYFNVVDDDNKRVFGESLSKVADYLVGMRFPTTLYRFRLQVAPKDAPLLKEQAKQREANKALLIVSSVLILLVGVAFFLYGTIKERKLNALKSDFIANVSHELKTPLSVVRMFAEMLLTERVSSPEKRQKYLEMICREAERLSGLIENVLDFAALERGKQTYEPVAADLADIVSRAVETLRHRLEQIEVRLHLPTQKLPLVLADEQAVLLAVINLLDNAVKYGEGTPIDVALTLKRRDITISVRDRGPGIPAAEARRVFDRFYRVRRAGQQIRGSGIGLSLVKHIAEAHGGRAWVENAGTGGAIVSFAVARTRRTEASVETPDFQARESALPPQPSSEPELDHAHSRGIVEGP